MNKVWSGSSVAIFVIGMHSNSKAKLNGRDTEAKSEGENSASITLTGSNAAATLNLYSVTGEDTRGYNTLEFDINVSSIEERDSSFDTIILDVRDTEGAVYSVNLYNPEHPPTSGVENWKHYALETSTFTGVNINKFKGIDLSVSPLHYSQADGGPGDCDRCGSDRWAIGGCWFSDPLTALTLAVA